MRNCLLSLLLVFTTVNQSALAKNTGGGTIVGNGAGVVESNFQYAYHALEKIINNCLLLENCLTQPEEREIVSNIFVITRQNSNRKDRLVFISEKANPGFFTTGESETNRIAKTDLQPDSAIYINTDMLYKKDGSPAINFANIVSLLVHEVGHQSGVLNHAVLDMIGAKIAEFSEVRTSHNAFKIEDTEEKVKIVFSVTNFEQPIKSTFLMFNWNDKKTIDLSNTLVGSLTCKHDSESFAGVQVMNGHFAFDQKNNLMFKAWVKISCNESFSSMTFVYKKDLEILLDGNLDFISLMVD